ncbi:MAG: TPM domain-containing protein [Chlorobi bacterium]|nr:TPM domain-containing protein [Chlorobiota bacterium]
MKERLIYEYFSDDDFLRISNKVKETEKLTAGEIRVSVKDEIHFSEKNKTVKELAQKEFYKLGMNETRDKTGILIFILLADKKFYILADSGINDKVEQTVWDEIRNEMQNQFKAGNYLDGILYAIEEIGNILARFFPIKPDDTNELSNKVVI